MNKPNSNSYTSFPIGIVNLVAINVLAFPIPVSWIADTADTWGNTLIIATGALILLNLLLIWSNYSSVNGNKTKITVSSLTKSIIVENIVDITA